MRWPVLTLEAMPPHTPIFLGVRRCCDPSSRPPAQRDGLLVVAVGHGSRLDHLGGSPPTTPRLDEGVERSTGKPDELADLDVRDPPLSDQPANESLPGAEIVTGLRDGEQWIVPLDLRYACRVGIEQVWAVLCDQRARRSQTTEAPWARGYRFRRWVSCGSHAGTLSRFVAVSLQLSLPSRAAVSQRLLLPPRPPAMALGSAVARQADPGSRGGTWEVNATVVRVPGAGLTVQPRPKTTAGWRIIALPEFAVRMLEDRRASSRRQPDAGVVFSPPLTGALRDPSNVSGDLRQLRLVRVRDLRENGQSARRGRLLQGRGRRATDPL
jgi:hypothetical protein